MRSLLTAVFAASLAVAKPQSESWTVGKSIKTTSGIVEGHASQWKPAVSEYLGVPFAEPPVNDLRFAAPKAYKSDKKIVAAKYGHSCPTNLGSPKNSTISYDKVANTILGHLGQVEDTFSEDCLTLNVWAKPQSGEVAKAVMLWIYGGGFNSGSSTSPSYNGARLADENDVIVVSVNYRTNIYGFPRAPFLPDLNLGLLDQRLGVEWVRDNIAAFGGDPKRITLFGQSAGGGSIDMYAYAWTKDPIVSGFIPESGSASVTTNTGGDLAAGWYATSQKLGCGGSEAGPATLACMRKQKWQDITNAIPKREVTPNLGTGGFGPTADGKVVFKDYPARRAAGNFIKAVRFCPCQALRGRAPIDFHLSPLSLVTPTTKQACTSYLALSAVLPMLETWEL
jgi:cholinesterase